MFFYGLVSQTEKAVEFFLEPEAAEALIGEVREDEHQRGRGREPRTQLVTVRPVESQ
jgi:hypothetical protein